MKVIIAGSRDITDYLEMVDGINASGFTITEVVSGRARGVDLNGEVYGTIMKIPVKEFPADWIKHGKAAGPIRNEQMGDYADAAIVIWDGKSKGSQHMANYMKKLKKPCYVYLPHIKHGFRHDDDSPTITIFDN